MAKTRMTDRAAWREGARIAVALIHHAERKDMANCASLEPQWRDGRPQNNFVLAYLREVRQTGDERVEAAFAATLSEFLSTASDGVYMDADGVASVAREHLVTAMQGVRHG